MSECACGCGLPAPLARRNRPELGHVKGQPLRFVNGHNRRGERKREWRVEPRGYSTDCWTWLGYVNDNGYGKATRPEGDRMTTAHRVLYQELVGPIPDGLDLDHLCRNRDCVNPEHVEPVTRAVNLRRGRRWPRESAAAE